MSHLLALSFTRAAPGWRHYQEGSLAGTALLLKDNASVLRGTQGEQKSPSDTKG